MLKRLTEYGRSLLVPWWLFLSLVFIGCAGALRETEPLLFRVVGGIVALWGITAAYARFLATRR